MSDREIRQLEKAKCKAQRSHNLKEESAICNQLGELLAKCGRFQDAIEEHRQELGISEGLGDVIGCAVANRKIGECFAELGNYEAALKHQRRHLDLARSVSSDIEEQRALATIGRTYLFMCEQKPEAQRLAEDAFLKSLAVVDERLEGKVASRDLSEMRARLFLNLGFLYDLMSQADKCSFYIRKSIFIAEKTQLHEDLYRANVNLASIHLRNGEHSKAIRCWEAARECARRTRDKYMESECYSSIGQTLLSLGDLSAGKRSLKKAFRLGSQQQSDRDIVRRNLKYAMKGCQLEEALSELTEGDQQGALSLYEQLGDLYCKVCCYTKAVDYYKLQLRCAETLGRPEKELAVIHVSLAATYSDLKDYQQAVTHYQAELGFRKGNPLEECKTWLNMALAVEEDGRGMKEVQRCMQDAMKCARKTGNSQMKRKVLRQLLALQQKWACPEVADTEAELSELCAASDSESSEEEEMENSESLQESDIELSQSEDEEDLEGYEKSVPGKRRAAQWNRRNEKGETVLHRACIEGNVKLVQCILDKGHPLNPRDYCGWTPLHEACNHGHLDIVQLLLDRGANINDPGGPLCEGTTPLHDALSSGNFHVAQLLIQKGASVTQRNAKGVTPMGSLGEWVQTYGKHLDKETRRNCKETETLLREALAGRVVQAPQHRAELQDSELFDAEGSQTLIPTPSRRDRDAAQKERTSSDRGSSSSRNERGSSSSRNERGSSSSRNERGSSSSRNEGGSTSSRNERGSSSSRNQQMASLESDGNDFGLHQSPPCWTSTQITREETLYEEDSENLLTPLKPVKKKPRFVVQRPSPDPDVASARTEVSLSPYSSSHQPEISEGGREAYQKAIQSLGSAKSRLLSQTLAQPEATAEDSSVRGALVPSEEYLGDDWLEDDLRNESRPRKRVRRSPSPVEIEEVEEYSDPEVEDMPEEPLQFRDRPPAPRNLSLSRKRSRQSKLTQIVDRAVVGRTKSSARSDVSVPRVMDSVRIMNTTVDSGSPIIATVLQTPVVALNPALPPPMRVRVRVQDNVFLIPIPHSDNDTREISWLAEQASQRYYQSCGLRPRLTLKKEGALLDPQDLILYVLQSNEEVLAEVQSWDLPPLTDRYRKSCRSLGVEEKDLVLKALEQQEMSPSLSLCRLALKSQDLGPLFRALKLQSSLTQLDLSGNLVGDTDIEELVALLGTVPNLTHLNLSGNRLTHEGVRKLVPVAGTEGGKPFEKLEELDLSLNPLGDGLTQPLASLLHHCPVLSTLNLRACQLSAKFLQQYRLLLADAFRGAVHLKNLYLSHNALCSTGVELILKTLPHDTISRLDLSAVTAGDSLMVEPVVRFLSQDGCVLSHLSLASNHLSDEAVQDLARCLPVSSLKSVDLSGNSAVGVRGLESLLIGIRERNRDMEDLNLTGCRIQGPLGTSGLDGVSSLLQGLRLASLSLSRKDKEALAQAWSRSDSLVVDRHNKLFLKRIN
ncbi:tonsoku-like protein [Hyperolius riggenbachi]|uniref:tonsoku-like protein n=1 Tax=Hyperolius riggenbachi TaxID=752182 RepID=UPI0035A2DFBA